jgi:hypothetical protein
MKHRFPLARKIVKADIKNVRGAYKWVKRKVKG